MAKILVLLVHGGNSESREDDNVKIREVKSNTYSSDLGKPIFSEVLDKYLDLDKFEFFSPLFPNAVDANYTEWVRFLEQILDSNEGLFNQIILVGHSLGTTMLQMYLSQNDVNRKFGLEILQLHLVGCCKQEGTFKTDDNWKQIEKQIEEIYLYHSTNDLVCNFSESEYYAANLNKAKFLKFNDRGHFDMEKFPELIDNINKAFK